jgi:hypothetical protein
MSNDKKQPMTKEEYISMMLKEIERVSLIALTYPEYSQRHPADIVAEVMEGYLLKLMQKQMEQLTGSQAIPTETPVQVKEELIKDNVVSFDKKKKETYH